MISRRTAIFSAACLVAAGGSYGLRPRRHRSLLGAGRLTDVTPSAFGDWSSRDITDLVAPQTPDSLEARLYDETVSRLYTSATTGAQVIALLAHGDTQSNAFQLHRPETCYPAFGFAINQSASLALPLGGGVTLPCRKLVAKAPDRQECIIYWARLGEYLPVSIAEQRLDRLRTSVDGYIADGLLARFSVVGVDTVAAFAALESFLPAFIRASSAAARPALIGSVRAAALAQAKA
jgi:EpsI family protein